MLNDTHYSDTTVCGHQLHCSCIHHKIQSGIRPLLHHNIFPQSSYFSLFWAPDGVPDGGSSCSHRRGSFDPCFRSRCTMYCRAHKVMEARTGRRHMVAVSPLNLGVNYLIVTTLIILGMNHQIQHPYPRARPPNAGSLLWGPITTKKE